MSVHLCTFLFLFEHGREHVRRNTYTRKRDKDAADSFMVISKIGLKLMKVIDGCGLGLGLCWSNDVDVVFVYVYVLFFYGEVEVHTTINQLAFSFTK